MDLVLFSAIPKAALFFLLLVAAAIFAEMIYLVKKKLNSSEVTLPKSLQNPSSLPPQPAMVAVTTEIVSETPKKGRLTRKTTMVILSTLLIALTIPVGLALVKQRQVTQKMAAGDASVVCSGGGKQNTDDTQTYWGILVKKQWQTEAECRACDVDCAKGLVGTFSQCLVPEISCSTVTSCTTQAGQETCGISATVPACSAVQLDCANNDNWQNASIKAGGVFINCEGCGSTVTPTPTPTPTPPAFTIQCQGAAAFDSNWAPIANLNTIAVGQIVYFTVNGQTNEPGGLTKARFTINGGTPVETTTKHGTDFYIQYTVATAGPYTVQGEVFNPALGWK